MKPFGIVGVVVLVLVMVLAGFSGLLLYMNQNQADTTGVAFEYKGLIAGSNSNGGKDLLDSTSYVTSWSGGGKSEKVVVQGEFKSTGTQLLGSTITAYRYVVYALTNNNQIQMNGVHTTTYDTGWVAGTNLVIGKGWSSVQTLIITITEPCVGIVRAEMYAQYAYFDTGLGVPIPRVGGALFAYDEAWLRSGVGSVLVQNSPNVVEEGQNVSLFVETGYSHSGGATIQTGGWTLNIYNPTGTSVMTKTIADNFAGTVKYQIPNGSYSPTSTNVYKVILRNELIDQDDAWFFTIGPGMFKKIPNLPTFKSTGDGKTLIPGDSVSVTITSVKNPLGYDIKGFWVWVSYETSASTTTQYVIEKAWYAATSDGKGSFSAIVTFTFPDAGQVRFQASAADTMNLNSGISSLQWTVYPKPPEPPPGPGPFDKSMVSLIIGVALVILLLVFAFIALTKVPQPWGIIAALVLIGLAVLAAWLFFGSWL